ncbi:response regulator [uncultured Shimia sp.]|uniref:response regulator n=1 Tax=uncultured Shimia sp. TaxID=573152 RepID=UPI00262531C1|nr:response regulator [uncultured Shimia sp.]
MKILAVDDDENIRDLLRASVSSETQHELFTASSGPEALKLIDAESDPFESFLLDIQMPEMNGIVLCQKIRKIRGYERTPIVMLTAMSQKKYVDQAFAAGATDYITKPFDFLELFSRIRVAEKLTNEQIRANQNRVAVLTLEKDLEKSCAINPSEPFEIKGLENVVGYVAFENYIMHLTRIKLMRSHVFATKIVEIESLHKSLSTIAFRQLLADVATTLAHAVRGTDSLITYRGGGIFLCSTSTQLSHSQSVFEMLLNAELAETSIPRFKDQKVVVAVGEAISMRALTRAGAMFSMTTAVDNVETRASLRQQDLTNLKRVLRSSVKRSKVNNVMERRAYEVLFGDIQTRKLPLSKS